LSGRGLCDELITHPEESYRMWCVVVCDLETSRIGAPYIYDISNLRVKEGRILEDLSYYQLLTYTHTHTHTYRRYMNNNKIILIKLCRIISDTWYSHVYLFLNITHTNVGKRVRSGI